MKANTYEKNWPFFNRYGGQSFPKEHLIKAQDEVEEFCSILRHEGIIVRRPDALNFSEVHLEAETFFLPYVAAAQWFNRR